MVIKADCELPGSHSTMQEEGGVTPHQSVIMRTMAPSSNPIKHSGFQGLDTRVPQSTMEMETSLMQSAEVTDMPETDTETSEAQEQLLTEEEFVLHEEETPDMDPS